MTNRRPFEFDNFIEPADQPKVVLDLSINKKKNIPQTDSCLPFLGVISNQLEKLLEQEKAENMRLIKKILTELSPQLLEKQNLQVICRFIEDKFPQFATKKVLEFYFNPAIIYQVRPLIEKIIYKKGYVGRILLHKDKTMPICDCKITWQQGETVFNSQEKIKYLEEMLTGENNE